MYISCRFDQLFGSTVEVYLEIIVLAYLCLLRCMEYRFPGTFLMSPGLGLLNTVTPSNLAERVSGTTPLKAFLILVNNSNNTVFRDFVGPPLIQKHHSYPFLERLI